MRSSFFMRRSYSGSPGSNMVCISLNSGTTCTPQTIQNQQFGSSLLRTASQSWWLCNLASLMATHKPSVLNHGAQAPEIALLRSNPHSTVPSSYFTHCEAKLWHRQSKKSPDAIQLLQQPKMMWPLYYPAGVRLLQQGLSQQLHPTLHRHWIRHLQRSC